MIAYLKAGLKDSVIKFVKILGWVALSAVITKIGSMVADWKPTTAEFVLVQGVLNALMPSVIKWATTKK